MANIFYGSFAQTAKAQSVKTHGLSSVLMHMSENPKIELRGYHSLITPGLLLARAFFGMPLFRSAV